MPKEARILKVKLPKVIHLSQPVLTLKLPKEDSSLVFLSFQLTIVGKE